MFGHLFFLTAMFLNDSFTTGSGNPFDNFLSLFDPWTITAMSLPCKRMMITHVALIAGGFLLTRLDEPTVGLLVLLAMKIALDVVLHRREHDKLKVKGLTKMKKILTVAGLFCLSSTCFSASILIENVRIFNGVDAALQQGHVLVEDGVIKTVSTSPMMSPGTS